MCIASSLFIHSTFAMLNSTLFQFFHWYHPTENSLWATAGREASKLASLGVTHVGLPPAYKSAKGSSEPGYAVYDLYDLGEFDQKDTTATKHGTKDEYLEAINSFHNAGVKVLADVVLNHMMGGDESKALIVQRVDAEDRNRLVGEPYLFESSSFRSWRETFRVSMDQRCFKEVCVNENICLMNNGYTVEGWDELVGTKWATMIIQWDLTSNSVTPQYNGNRKTGVSGMWNIVMLMAFD